MLRYYYPFPLQIKKFPAFSVLELAGFLFVWRFKAFFVLRYGIILKSHKTVCIGLVGKNRSMSN
nr:MAG TPA: hypothetical protein [Caudoviricetes sp.]DAQ57628.1 MAG TPA: hypothetical protein [Caudoviricetes sp.]